MGETVFDIVFRNGKPQAGVPGGSTFNSIVSLGRCGLRPSILTEVGDDSVGALVLDFMRENGVDAGCTNVIQAKTPVSMAFLDKNNDAHYEFYRDAAEAHPDFIFPEINEDDVVLFGSFFALNPAVRSHVRKFLEYARSSGAIIYYDVNFRPSHKKDLGSVMGAIEENCSFADIFRGSRDDFVTLYGMEDAEAVFREKIADRCSNLIFTDGARPLSVRDVSGFVKTYEVPPVESVATTIGAGDSFNAGFVYGIIKCGITRRMIGDGLSETQWDALVESACQFSSNCCASMYNYVTPEFAAQRRL